MIDIYSSIESKDNQPLSVILSTTKLKNMLNLSHKITMLLLSEVGKIYMTRSKIKIMFKLSVITLKMLLSIMEFGIEKQNKIPLPPNILSTVIIKQ